jgi:hypothetical protein
VPATLLEAHRLDLEELLRLADADLSQLWQGLTGVGEIRDALLALLPQLAETYGLAAASLGADWYDELRDAAEVKGRFRAIPVEPEVDRTGALARWAVSPLFQAEPDLAASKTLLSGGFQRLVADADRNTVLLSSRNDPQGGKWSRETTGASCGFCVMLSGRGAVYLSKQTADFQSHDHCDCIALPHFT